MPTQTIIDDNGIELIVAYKADQSPSQIEECHGLHEVGNLVSVSLESVELVIAGVGMELLPALSKKQQSFIEQKIINSHE